MKDITTICIVRHGETDWNVQGRLQGRTDIPLNENGKMQAKKCGEFLAKTSWEVIITSPLKRARETAEIIAHHVKKPVITNDAFIEKSFGEAEGMTAEVREKVYLDKQYPGQEQPEELQSRLLNGLQYIQRQYPDKQIILVAHGAVIHMILEMTLNQKLISPKVRLQNACLSTIRFQLELDTWIVDDYNQVKHLS